MQPRLESRQVRPLYSPEGDLSHAPSYLPGSPNYSRPADLVAEAIGRQRVDVFVVAGFFIGDPAACAARLLALMKAKLAPLRYVMTLKDTGRVRNTKDLQIGLLRLVASSIPCHWTRGMPPAQTEEAMSYVDTTISAATGAILMLHDSPCTWRR